VLLSPRLGGRFGRLSLLLVALAFAGCGGGGGSGGGGESNTSSTSASTSASSGSPAPGCKLGFLGDPGKPVEMHLIARGKERSTIDLTEGGPVPMLLPPQGGRIIAVGIRATNLSACGIELTGALRDAATGQIRLDQRTVNLEPSGDGWGQSVIADMSTLANVPTCPNQWASTDVFGQPFELTLSIADAEGHAATQKISLVPFCAEPESEDECACECQKDYVLGQSCGEVPGP